ncbi:hypothetical protein BSF41_18500 [Flavobacterium sp. ACN2]|jgi:hypothetical protein|uniref:hypothetical protein n=1 Tax=Flavobacterium sp. ACN2 TaxID=1975676 RepID=UPI000BB3D46F|nr:hypothetical protein [Flavobacterium sp. ACN2]PBI90179.1 hypothetical protein BSF41_18500 [Flavobacterium sp. ACN2]
MKKLFTENHKNIMTCNDFEIKFKDYLKYIEMKNPNLYNLFIKNIDFSIQNVNDFKKEFNVFFELWLKEVYGYSLVFNEKNVTQFMDSFIVEFKMTDIGFSELFSNFNFYKKVNSAKDVFFIYDISQNEDIKYNEIIKNNK